MYGEVQRVEGTVVVHVVVSCGYGGDNTSGDVGPVMVVEVNSKFVFCKEM